MEKIYCGSYAYALVIPKAKEINSCGVQRTMEHAWVVSMFYSQRHMPCQKKVIRNMFKQYESSNHCQDQDSGLRSLKKVMLNTMEKENHLPHLWGGAILVQDKKHGLKLSTHETSHMAIVLPHLVNWQVMFTWRMRRLKNLLKPQSILVGLQSLRGLLFFWPCQRFDCPKCIHITQWLA